MDQRHQERMAAVEARYAQLRQDFALAADAEVWDSTERWEADSPYEFALRRHDAATGTTLHSQTQGTLRGFTRLGTERLGLFTSATNDADRYVVAEADILPDQYELDHLLDGLPVQEAGGYYDYRRALAVVFYGGIPVAFYAAPQGYHAHSRYLLEVARPTTSLAATLAFARDVFNTSVALSPEQFVLALTVAANRRAVAVLAPEQEG